jgi:hypothetical protein
LKNTKDVSATQRRSPERAKELEQLVEASALPASGELLSNSGRDLYQYEITIEDGGSTISVVLMMRASLNRPNQDPLFEKILEAKSPGAISCLTSVLDRVTVTSVQH